MDKKPVEYSWDRLGMAEKEWRTLAMAFYSLAHNDFSEFNALPDILKKHPAGLLCLKYIETNDHKYIEEAGEMLTGTKHWYVFLGRCF